MEKEEIIEEKKKEEALEEKNETIEKEKREDDKISKREEKYRSWLNNKENLLFLGVLIFAFIVRLYFFYVTNNQPLWYDEADYMSMAKSFAFGDIYNYNFHPVRPILFSLILTLFLKMSSTEFLPRLFLFILSIASVIGTYYLGKEIYNKKTGLIASLLMSVFYLNLFFSYRLLVDLHSLTFFTFSAFFIYKYLKTDSKKMLYIGAAIIAIGTLFRLTTALLLFGVFIYLLITERLKFFKKKEIWIALLIFFLILLPYLIWGTLKFKGFFLLEAAALPMSITRGNPFIIGLIVFKNYLAFFPTYLSWPILIFFILGLFSMYKLFLGFDILMKQKNMKLRRDLYLLLILLSPFLISFLAGYNEDRYILSVFPAVFIVIGFFILKIYNQIEKKAKLLAIIFLIVLLGFAVFFQLRSANSLINIKKTSYLGVKEAGLWIKQNSDKSAIVFTKSWPQNIYYSDRKTYPVYDNQTKFEEDLEKFKPEFVIISVFEAHSQWLYEYPSEHPDKFEPVKVFSLDAQQQQPALIIYKMKY